MHTEKDMLTENRPAGDFVPLKICIHNDKREDEFMPINYNMTSVRGRNEITYHFEINKNGNYMGGGVYFLSMENHRN